MYASYLWKDANGTIMQYPILYGRDKVEIVKRGSFYNLGSELLLDVPLKLWSPASNDYSELFNQW